MNHKLGKHYFISDSNSQNISTNWVSLAIEPNVSSKHNSYEWDLWDNTNGQILADSESMTDENYVIRLYIAVSNLLQATSLQIRFVVLAGNGLATDTEILSDQRTVSALSDSAFTFIFPVYIGGFWKTNGCKVEVKSSVGNLELTKRTMYITKEV